MLEIKYLENPVAYNRDGAFITHLNGVKSKDQLFMSLYRTLQLPTYFGFNWDALSECLGDFDWIKKKDIVLIHDELPELDDETLKLYLQVLNETIKEWRKSDKHSFEVFFPKHSKKILEGNFN